MKVLHVCLANFYIDHYAYQENLLPRFQKKAGHEVEIIASTEIFTDHMRLGYTEPSEYVNEDGIKVIRIPYVSWLPHKAAVKLRIYSDVEKYLEDFKPDFIFLHDIQFLSINVFIRYKKNHPHVRMAADGHTDYRNSARGFISKWILHGIIYKNAIRKAIPYIEKFYGTLPSRNIFFEEMYGIPKEKISFLPMGTDDDILRKVESEGKRDTIRKFYGVRDDECLFITGGKIGKDKKDILLLMRIIAQSNLSVKLLIFGSVSPELEEKFDVILQSDKIIYAGWVNEEKSYELLSAADVAVYPCLHSTLWEQSAGIGLPCILHRMEGFTHMNINNNCCFMEVVSAKEMKKAIQYVYDNLEILKTNAMECREFFSYKKIADSILEPPR